MKSLNGRRVIWLLLIVLGTTLASASSAQGCPNDSARTGFSAMLPDCRAYELVSPANSDGRQIVPLVAGLTLNLFPTELLTASGDNAIYMTEGMPLSEPPEANGTLDLYEARRFADGWRTTRRLSPSGEEAVLPNAGGVSPDHLYSLTEAAPLDGGAKEGGSLASDGAASYLGNPDGTFELLGIGSMGSERAAQGRFIDEQGEHIIFSTGGLWCSGACPIAQLESNAAPPGTPSIYDRAADGPTHVISLLPGDIPPAAGEAALYQGTSANGQVVAFKIGGSLYVRVDNSNTYPVTTEAATFAGLSASGDNTFYVKAGNIFRFDVASKNTIQINASGDAEVVNVSADGSHVYFLSKSLLDASNGVVGEPNLYAWSDDGRPIRYVGTVVPSDLEGVPALNKWTSWAVNQEGPAKGPGGASSRTTPDGTILVFESQAQLTSYDNQGHNEIYLYDDSDGSVRCISCNPAGTAASSDARLESYVNLQGDRGGMVNVVRNLSEDGRRVFFETYEALLPADTDGVNDIYEWQEGVGGAGSELALISSGKSTYYSNPGFPARTYWEPNVIFSITPEGNDVLFLTGDQLTAEAGVGGVPALYSARVGGGFVKEAPLPVTAAKPEPPSLAVAQSSQFVGKGNVKPRCRRQRHQKSKTQRRGCHRRKHKVGHR